MNDRIAQLSAAIAALEAQRATLGEAVIATVLAPLQSELDALRSHEKQAQQQLKQVTVLFVDVVGSTAMGQQLDPEEIHAIMDGALERFTAIVSTHFGRVLQYTGDGMLAAFGAGEANEGDVESAVRAGLAILEDAQAHSAEVRRRHRVPDFNVRAGLHTGTVLLGGGVDAEGSIRGATVNVAARMEQSAPPGRLRISHDTYRHVRGLFEVSEPVPVLVKGIEQPLRSYLVERAKPRAFRVASRGIEGVHTKMIGRETELDLVRATFVATGAERRSRAITIVGEAGLGKSRLLAEFQQTLDLDACWLLLGRAHPRSALHPYGVLRDMLLGQVQIVDSDSAESARQKLSERLAPLFSEEGEAPIHLIGQLIGLDFSTSAHVQELLGDEARFKELAFDACLLCLHRLGESRPVVVVLDDLHWADAGTLSFMRRLLSASQDTPLLSLIMTRPTLFETQVDWVEGDIAHKRVDLTPLDKTFSRELADVLLQRIDDVPAALRAVITDGAEGNPFYMEELVKMLIDDGVIEVDAERWHVLPDKLLRVHVPTTLTGVLQARLDALGEREKSALQQAAVVGHVFWDQALAAIDAAAIDAIPMLLRKQLVVRRDGQLDNGEYAFHHHLLHQVAYGTVLREQRQRGHERVGAFWSARAEVTSPEEVTPAACRALAEAHDHRRLADPASFASWFDAQFVNYLRAFANATLFPLAQSVVEICEQHHGPDHVETARALTNLARMAVQRRDMEVAEPALRRALVIQERELEADHLDTVRTVAVLGGVLQGRGDYAAAEPFFRRALAVRERVLGAEHRLTLATLSDLAYVVKELDRLDEAEELSRRVLQVRERVSGPDTPETADALTSLGEVLVKKGDATGAEPVLRRALAIQQRRLPADNADLGLTMWHLAEALRALGRSVEAEPLARRTLEIWEGVFGPDHEWTAWGLICLAEIRLALGAPVDAVEPALRAARILERLFGSAHPVLGSTLNLHGRALVAVGDLAAAEVALARALEIQSALAPNGAATAETTRALLESCRQRALSPKAAWSAPVT
ncbi:MAG TPA: tetratricopeptide repeat protein [Caldimonas sp.]|jgi:class 3 adenylate cyclase/tetratricopeptide (TPR) repeat protein